MGREGQGGSWKGKRSPGQDEQQVLEEQHEEKNGMKNVPGENAGGKVPAAPAVEHGASSQGTAPSARGQELRNRSSRNGTSLKGPRQLDLGSSARQVLLLGWLEPVQPFLSLNLLLLIRDWEEENCHNPEHNPQDRTRGWEPPEEQVFVGKYPPAGLDKALVGLSRGKGELRVSLGGWSCAQGSQGVLRAPR